MLSQNAQSNGTAPSRVSRIKESWDRATSIGLLGALSLLGGDVSSPNTGLVATADAQEVDLTTSTSANPAASVTAQAAPASDPIDIPQGAPTADGNPPPAEDNAAKANPDSDEAQGDADDDSPGSSTSLQLIEAQLVAATREPGLHESMEARIELPVIPLAIPEQTAAETAGQGITVHGTDAPDVIVGTSGADNLSGGGGNDQIHGGGGDDRIQGGAGDDKVSGGSGNDVVKGGSGDDTVDGGRGNDTVDGGDGDDCVSGGSGNDVVIGGLGTDWLTGGDGADCFQFNSFDDSGSTPETRDHILDFKQGEDKIDFVKINADFAALGNQSLVFVGLDDFNPGQGQSQFRYSHFRGDADDDRTLIELSHGDDHGHMQIELHGFFTMTVDDFLL